LKFAITAAIGRAMTRLAIVLIMACQVVNQTTLRIVSLFKILSDSNLSDVKKILPTGTTTKAKTKTVGSTAKSLMPRFC
jgi:hypothetical protein